MTNEVVSSTRGDYRVYIELHLQTADEDGQDVAAGHIAIAIAIAIGVGVG